MNNSKFYWNLIWTGQPDSTYHNFFICMFSILCAFKIWFHRKSVLFKPFKKRYIIACASKHILWSMDVSVNKTRNQKLTEMKQKFRLNIALAFYESLTHITLILSAWCSHSELNDDDRTTITCWKYFTIINSTVIILNYIQSISKSLLVFIIIM